MDKLKKIFCMDKFAKNPGNSFTADIYPYFVARALYPNEITRVFGGHQPSAVNFSPKHSRIGYRIQPKEHECNTSTL